MLVMSSYLDRVPQAEFEVIPTPDEVAFFRDHGYLVVERLTTDEEVAWIRRIFERIFDPEQAGVAGAPIDRSGTLPAGEASRLSQAFFPEIQYPALLQTVHRRNAMRYAAALLDVPLESLTTWGHMIYKPPGGRAALWHQDHAYWQPELDFCALGVWLPLHDVTTEMGAMQFIPGSHKRGLLPHRHDDAPAMNVLTVVEEVDATTAVACPLKAGGATFHHSETLHYTAPNTTDRPRLAYPMEVQIKPVRRTHPVSMPWVDEFRAATGDRPLTYVANGQIYPI
jgi:ectoine hydroxylase-related dioxygenase (phytanoyl-CoA dioxygenase family)